MGQWPQEPPATPDTPSGVRAGWSVQGSCDSLIAGQVGQGLEQPEIVEGVPAHRRGWNEILLRYSSPRDTSALITRLHRTVGYREDVTTVSVLRALLGPQAAAIFQPAKNGRF